MMIIELIGKLKNYDMDQEVVLDFGESSYSYHSIDDVFLSNNVVTITCGKEHSGKLPPTEKQIELIRKIENLLNLKFTGKTKQTAWKFINDNLDKYHDVQDAYAFSESCRNYKPSKEEELRNDWLEKDQKRLDESYYSMYKSDPMNIMDPGDDY